jgi:hypothetical protein
MPKMKFDARVASCTICFEFEFPTLSPGYLRDCVSTVINMNGYINSYCVPAFVSVTCPAFLRLPARLTGLNAILYAGFGFPLRTGTQKHSQKQWAGSER